MGASVASVYHGAAGKERGRAIEIPVRAGSGMSLSIEIAEACRGLLLRSATPRDAKLLAARAIAPTEQSGHKKVFGSYCLTVRAAFRAQTKESLCGGK